MDIRTLDLCKITGQYLDYIIKLEELNFDLAGDYLYLSATLVLLKSKSCISATDIKEIIGEEIQSEMDIHSREDLIKRLENLKHIQHLAKKLSLLPKLGVDHFKRPKIHKSEVVEEVFAPQTSQMIVSAMLDVMSRLKRRYKVVKRDRLSIKEKLLTLKTLLLKGPTTLANLIQDDEEGLKLVGPVTNHVLTFISLLELARLKQLQVFQNEPFGEIYVEVREGIETFDVSLADGFEDPNASDATQPTLPLEFETIDQDAL